MVSSAGPVARWNDSMKTWMKDAIMATEKMSCLPEVIDVAGIFRELYTYYAERLEPPFACWILWVRSARDSFQPHR